MRKGIARSALGRFGRRYPYCSIGFAAVAAPRSRPIRWRMNSSLTPRPPRVPAPRPNGFPNRCPAPAQSAAAGGAHCPLHVVVARLLAAQAGGLVEMHRPDVGDTAFSLVGLAADAAEEPMLELLRARYGGVSGTSVAADGTIHPVRRAATVGWERGWSVSSSTGHLARLTLHVDASQPHCVQLLVNQRLVFSAVPEVADRALAERLLRAAATALEAVPA